MTEAQLVRLVRVWQQRLALERWQLEVVVDVDRWVAFGNDLGEQGHDASVSFRVKYHEAVLYLNPEKAREWTPTDAVQHVVHELVHLVLRPLEVTVHPLEDLVHRDAWQVFDDAHDRALELVVDELARRFVELEAELHA